MVEGDFLHPPETRGFGPIAYVQCFHEHQLALVEYEKLEDARAAVTHAQNNEVMMFEEPVKMFYW